MRAVAGKVGGGVTPAAVAIVCLLAFSLAVVQGSPGAIKLIGPVLVIVGILLACYRALFRWHNLLALLLLVILFIPIRRYTLGGRTAVPARAVPTLRRAAARRLARVAPRRPARARAQQLPRRPAARGDRRRVHHRAREYRQHLVPGDLAGGDEEADLLPQLPLRLLPLRRASSGRGDSSISSCASSSPEARSSRSSR